MEYAIIMPSSKVYVRGLTSFGHAFKQLRMEPGWEQSWFIVKEDQFPQGDFGGLGVNIFFPPPWVEVEEKPCPWKKFGKARGNPRMSEHQ